MSEPGRERRGLPPALAVAGELGRALVAVPALPLHGGAYLARRARLRREARDDLAAQAQPAAAPAALALPDRPLRIFVSCAEPSGERHGVSLVDSLRAVLAEHGAPPPVLAGLGGDLLADRGVDVVGDPVGRASMGFDVGPGALPFYLRLLTAAARRLRSEAFDLVLPVDSPALHVPLGRLARGYGRRVAHFVTPQYWGWAPWRVAGYRRAVDLALTILPFEPPWFERHGVHAAHVGHPLLDALEGEPDGRDPAGPLALLPGSRSGVIDRNLPWMLAAVERLRARVGAVDVVLPHDRGEHTHRLAHHVQRAGATRWVSIESGGLHDALARCRGALSVSGTVLLDLLHHRLPTVVVYRLARRRQVWLYRHFLTSPWFASINLLAGREVVPEFCFRGDGPAEEVGSALERCYKDEAWRARCAEGMEEAARRLGAPGAARRAALQAVALAAAPSPSPGAHAAPGPAERAEK